MNLKFYDKLNRIAFGYFSNLYLTTDGGTTWEDQIENYIPGSNIPALFSSAAFAGSKDKIVVGTCMLLYTVLVYSPQKSSVTDDIHLEDIIISPNPATDFLEISYSTWDIDRRVNPTVDDANHALKGVVNLNIEIFNVLGTKFPPRLTSSATPQEGNLKLDVSGLSPGVYFVKVGVKVGKFIKI